MYLCIYVFMYLCIYVFMYLCIYVFVIVQEVRGRIETCSHQASSFCAKNHMEMLMSSLIPVNFLLDIIEFNFKRE